ncbi:MAG: threonine--tRNA ligase [Actinobacteria bacterium]|nr:threonine--tRNA ligase [Actinomycetota bacterium]MDQ3533435.1 threonine--tRNA ligase [Actinomycetota bacterium]
MVDGNQRDLAFVPAGDSSVAVITQTDELGRAIVRHSTAHVLAQAVLRLWPESGYAIGPPIEDGFYYDFDMPRPFTPEDIERIESEMSAIIKENQRFERTEVERDEALDLFKSQPYKIEIIEGVRRAGDQADDGLESEVSGDEVISIYRNRRAAEQEEGGGRADGGAEFVDLCRGPHVPATGRIKAFKLLRTSGAYWRGDEHRPMLQRIYGTAWESKDALKAYLVRLEEAERRDHRRLGRELELYSWPDEVGPGLAVWHPNGAIIRSKLEELSRRMHLEHGYQPVYTPHIGKGALWSASGHLDYYRENMFPAMNVEGTEYFDKPMNCPFHVLVFRSKTRSYRELPIRLSELGTVYRYERSGTVHGLLRARGMTQDDSHIFCRPDQVVDEIVGVIDFLRELYGTVGLGPDRVRFSTKPDKAVGAQEMWERAESAIPEALDRAGLPFQIDAGDGAFYGPKIDVDVRDAIGRYWQLATIQVDFHLPERFGLEYVDDAGERIRPAMIHRALFGSIERFTGVLVEHFAGAFPAWLAPLQVAVIPIADRHTTYAGDVLTRLERRAVRATVDDSDDTLGARIRRHQLHKVPYMLIVGDNEVSSETVSVRPRSGAERRDVRLDDFVAQVSDEIEQRRL